VTRTLSTPLHLANGTHDRGYRYQTVHHRRIQHTSSHAAQPHVSNHTTRVEIEYAQLGLLIQILSSHRRLDAPTHQQRDTDIARQQIQSVDPGDTCTYRHLHILTPAHTDTYTYRHLHIPKPAHTDTCTYRHLHIPTPTHTYTYTYRQLHIPTPTHTDTYTYRHATQLSEPQLLLISLHLFYLLFYFYLYILGFILYVCIIFYVHI